MDISQLPFISYFVNWDNSVGTYIFGFLGLAVSVAFCVMCWKNIRNQIDDSL